MKHDFGDTKPTYGELVKGPEGITGILMVVLMLIAFTLATRWFRRNVVKLPRPFDRVTGFNAFWYSHHLFVIVYALLIVHGVCLYLVHQWYRKTVRNRALFCRQLHIPSFSWVAGCIHYRRKSCSHQAVTNLHWMFRFRVSPAELSS